MKFKKGDRVEVIWRSELYRGAVTQVVEVTNEIVVKLAKKPSIDYLFEQNQVSKVELVKLPKFVADAIDTFQDEGDSRAVAIDYEVYTDELVKELSLDRKMRGWLWETSNQELFARAWMGEYEVEQEPLFIMPIPYSVLPVHYYINRLDEISFKQGNAQKFTWNEIEKYFPEITKYAVKVEGVAE
ncbi:DUF1642 domain-containing protein [Listeria monocytogenes]|uniref:DUF1642 domain-containing protein n=1 Tax=Listeria monocytogenes TaxID=1639 RepID=UPI001FD78BD8|nr:DUF1642 domain-containing protein [Listeria monocytogenes]